MKWGRPTNITEPVPLLIPLSCLMLDLTSVKSHGFPISILRAGHGRSANRLTRTGMQQYWRCLNIFNDVLPLSTSRCTKHTSLFGTATLSVNSSTTVLFSNFVTNHNNKNYLETYCVFIMLKPDVTSRWAKYWKNQSVISCI